ncbi:unnamed protein product [Polarella glacialis]|uniref:Uncharacterized protein n=1 Tax=Polarella glacialis TaxID=89957 RepID=A0A813DJL1_POLGL|nr:unnamed protein product [Polarella glacialis]
MIHNDHQGKPGPEEQALTHDTIQFSNKTHGKTPEAPPRASAGASIGYNNNNNNNNSNINNKAKPTTATTTTTLKPPAVRAGEHILIWYVSSKGLPRLSPVGAL